MGLIARMRYRTLTLSHGKMISDSLHPNNFAGGHTVSLLFDNRQTGAEVRKALERFNQRFAMMVINNSASIGCQSRRVCGERRPLLS